MMHPPRFTATTVSFAIGCGAGRIHGGRNGGGCCTGTSSPRGMRAIGMLTTLPTMMPTITSMAPGALRWSLTSAVLSMPMKKIGSAIIRNRTTASGRHPRRPMTVDPPSSGQPLPDDMIASSGAVATAW